MIEKSQVQLAEAVYAVNDCIRRKMAVAHASPLSSSSFSSGMGLASADGGDLGSERKTTLDSALARGFLEAMVGEWM